MINLMKIKSSKFISPNKFEDSYVTNITIFLNREKIYKFNAIYIQNIVNLHDIDKLFVCLSGQQNLH